MSGVGVPNWINKNNLKIQPSLSVGEIKAELSKIITPLFTSEKTKDALVISDLNNAPLPANLRVIVIGTPVHFASPIAISSLNFSN